MQKEKTLESLLLTTDASDSTNDTPFVGEALPMTVILEMVDLFDISKTIRTGRGRNKDIFRHILLLAVKARRAELAELAKLAIN